MRLDTVDICNFALSLCGSTDFIQAIDDPNSVSARRCNQFFTPAVENVLRVHDWNCASDIVELAELSEDPIIRPYYYYALPFDCVRVVNVYGSNSGYSPYDRWRLIGRKLQTDLQTVYLRYVKFPEDYKSLDTLLSTSIAYELAVMLCATLVKDPNMYGFLRNQRDVELNRAKAIDTLENKYLYVDNDVYEDNRMRVT